MVFGIVFSLIMLFLSFLAGLLTIFLLLNFRIIVLSDKTHWINRFILDLDILQFRKILVTTMAQTERAITFHSSRNLSISGSLYLSDFFFTEDKKKYNIKFKDPEFIAGSLYPSAFPVFDFLPEAYINPNFGELRTKKS